MTYFCDFCVEIVEPDRWGVCPECGNPNLIVMNSPDATVEDFIEEEGNVLVK
jgi:hypothetical protein